MAQNEELAAVLRERLVVWTAIDESAQLSFLESAHFRFELIGIVERFEKHTLDAPEALAALEDLHRRVTSVIAAAL